MKTALVTGGCGQIGSHVVEALLDRGYEVIVLDPRPPYTWWREYIEKDKIIYRHGSTVDLHQLLTLQREYDIDEIYSFGGWLGSEELTPLFDTAVIYNTIGERNVFELAKSLNVPVYYINIEFAGYNFTDGYSVSKEMALRMAIEYAKKYGVRIVGSYVHHIFCERQRLMPTRKIMPTLISYAITGRKFRIFGSPDKMMDLLYARDFAELVIDLLNNEKTQTVNEHIYDIGVGYGIRLEDLVKMVYREAGREPNYMIMHDIRGQKPDPYKVAKNDWKEILGERKLRGVKEMLPYVMKKYKERYSYEEFELAVAIYEQRHRFKEVGV